MTEEFCLSDKLRYRDVGFIKEVDVKEFIRLLKKELYSFFWNDYDRKIIKKIIHNLAGDKLI